MSHDHHHHHHHHDNVSAGNDLQKRKLIWSTVLNLVISVAEIIGGIVSNSLALVSDALHNLGDTSALFIAYLATLISHKNNSEKKTFGYKRIEILAALLNAIILAVIIVYLFIEAVRRIGHPEPIKGLIMFVVAVIGFFANLISVMLLRKNARTSINIKAAYLHLLGDTVSSVVVIVCAILIYFFKVYWIDPVVTFLLGIYLLRETFLIVKESVDILMQSTPHGLDLNEVKSALESIPEIDNIHHVHAWNLNDQDIQFECHIDLRSDLRVSETEMLQHQVRKILLNKFKIDHVTVQYEYNCCEDKNMIHSR
ncbi:MAG TPA: cation diffusion facilitator family transporter [Bacteroidales bacterium]|nr:cation diffusion facilitator family transporter [Bacteroidales bacterium]